MRLYKIIKFHPRDAYATTEHKDIKEGYYLYNDTDEDYREQDIPGYVDGSGTVYHMEGNKLKQADHKPYFFAVKLEEIPIGE
jgi:hypothetical protein